MGHSTSFKKLTDDGRDMTSYIKSLNTVITEDALKTTRDEFKKFINTTFPEGTIRNVKDASEVYDWRQSDENNLDVITKTISLAADGAIKALEAEELLPAAAMIGIATSCITDVLGLFATRTSGSYTSKITMRSLSPGLRIIAVSVSMELVDKQIWNKGSLVVSWIMYQVIFSETLQKSEIREKILDDASKRLDEDLKTLDSFNTKINDLQVALFDMDPGPEYDIAEQNIKNKLKLLKSQNKMVTDLSKTMNQVRTTLK